MHPCYCLLKDLIVWWIYNVSYLKTQDLTPLDDFDQPLSTPARSRVRGESTYHVTSDMKSTLVSAKVMIRCLLAKEKLKEDIN